MLENLSADLKSALPPVLFRTDPDFRRLVGLSPRSIANLDAKGKGPRQRVRIGGVVGYPRHALIEWMKSRTKIIQVGHG